MPTRLLRALTLGGGLLAIACAVHIPVAPPAPADLATDADACAHLPPGSFPALLQTLTEAWAALERDPEATALWAGLHRVKTTSSAAQGEFETTTNYTRRIDRETAERNQEAARFITDLRARFQAKARPALDHPVSINIPMTLERYDISRGCFPAETLPPFSWKVYPPPACVDQLEHDPGFGAAYSTWEYDNPSHPCTYFPGCKPEDLRWMSSNEKKQEMCGSHPPDCPTHEVVHRVLTAREQEAQSLEGKLFARQTWVQLLGGESAMVSSPDPQFEAKVSTAFQLRVNVAELCPANVAAAEGLRKASDEQRLFFQADLTFVLASDPTSDALTQVVLRNPHLATKPNPASPPP